MAPLYRDDAETAQPLHNGKTNNELNLQRPAFVTAAQHPEQGEDPAQKSVVFVNPD